MHPVVLAITLVALASVVFCPRRFALAPVLACAFLTPFNEQLLVFGFHLFPMRIVVMGASLRILFGVKLATIFRGRLTPIDKVFFWWAFFRGATFILLYRQTGAVVAQVAFWLDAYGEYVLYRYLIQNEDDITGATKILSAIALVLAACMTYEYLTRTNVFSYIKDTPIVPWIRDGKVRAQGVFSNSITAGVFGATLLPLFFYLVKSRRSAFWGIAGIAASTAIVLTSVASTAASAFLGGILALCLWPIRSQMRMVRWGLVFCLLTLCLVMKAPIWYVVMKLDFVGGHGWDRAYLIDQFVKHFFDWWLLGTKNNASWGADTWDACNQYAAEGITGGLVSLILFLCTLSRSFGLIGKARKRVRLDVTRQWFFWCLGAALFSHIIAFVGVDYFDQTKDLWFAFLAIISTAIANSETSPVKRVRTHQSQAVLLHETSAPEMPLSQHCY